MSRRITIEIGASQTLCDGCVFRWVSLADHEAVCTMPAFAEPDGSTPQTHGVRLLACVQAEADVGTQAREAIGEAWFHDGADAITAITRKTIHSGQLIHRRWAEVTP